MRREITIIAMLMLLSDVGGAQEYPDGARIYRVQAGTVSRLINATQDEIQVGIARLLLPKSKGWFKQDVEAGIQVTTIVNGRKTQLGGQAEKISFTQMYTVKVQDYNQGLLSLPLEGTIVPSFPLTGDGYRYTSMDFLISFLRSKENTGFGNVVRGLAKLTSNYAFPTTPFGEGIRRLADLTGDLLTDDKDAGNGIEKRIPTAVVSLVFSPGGKPVGSFLDSTGVFAILFGSDDRTSPGFVDIKQAGSQCLKVGVAETRSLLVSPTDSSGKCGTAYHEVSNAYAMFYVMAFAVTASATDTIAYRSPWSATGWSNLYPGATVAFRDMSFAGLSADSRATLVAFLDNDTTAIKRFAGAKHSSATLSWKVPASKAVFADYANAVSLTAALGLNMNRLVFTLSKLGEPAIP